MAFRMFSELLAAQKEKNELCCLILQFVGGPRDPHLCGRKQNKLQKICFIKKLFFKCTLGYNRAL